MAKAFQVGIYSCDQVVYTGKIVSLTVPSAVGYMGVLADHAPIIARLKPGRINFRDEAGKEKTIETQAPGYLEVASGKATVLLE